MLRFLQRILRYSPRLRKTRTNIAQSYNAYLTYLSLVDGVPSLLSKYVGEPPEAEAPQKITMQHRLWTGSMIFASADEYLESLRTTRDVHKFSERSTEAGSFWFTIQRSRSQ